MDIESWRYSSKLELLRQALLPHRRVQDVTPHDGPSPSRCLPGQVEEKILFDLWRADFPHTTIDEEVMNIDQGQEDQGAKWQGLAWKRVGAEEQKRADSDEAEHVHDDVVSL